MKYMRHVANSRSSKWGFGGFPSTHIHADHGLTKQSDRAGLSVVFQLLGGASGVAKLWINLVHLKQMQS